MTKLCNKLYGSEIKQLADELYPDIKTENKILGPSPAMMEFTVGGVQSLHWLQSHHAPHMPNFSKIQSTTADFLIVTDWDEQ